MNTLQLDQIAGQLDEAFGSELSFSDKPLSTEDIEVLSRVFGEQGYQRYLQDQINRQIIRDYLTNALLQDHLSIAEFDTVSARANSIEGRAALSLQMLMMSIVEAAELACEEVPNLRALSPERRGAPHLNLIKP